MFLLAGIKIEEVYLFRSTFFKNEMTILDGHYGLKYMEFIGQIDRNHVFPTTSQDPWIHKQLAKSIAIMGCDEFIKLSNFFWQIFPTGEPFRWFFRGWCFWLVASSPGTKKGGFLEAFGEFSRFFFRHDERSTSVVIGVHQIWKHCALGVFNSLDDEKKIRTRWWQLRYL